MTGKDIFENCSGINPAWIMDSAPDIPKKKAPGRVWARVAAAAACLSLMLSLGFWRVKQESVKVDPLEGRYLPVERDEMIWAVEKNSEVGTDEDAFMLWKGFTVEINLYDALEKNTDPETYFAVTVTKHGQQGMDAFQYQGITLGEIDRRQEEWDILWKNMMALEKEGLWLRFGEVLYTTGIPKDVPLVGGDKWTEENYRNTIARYGEEMLAKYIVDGELLTEKLVRDREVLEQEMEDLRVFRSEAYKAFRKQNASQLQERLAKQKLAVWYEGGNLYLFVTEQELAKVKLDKDEYTLYLASRKAFDAILGE